MQVCTQRKLGRKEEQIRTCKQPEWVAQEVIEGIANVALWPNERHYSLEMLIWPSFE